MIKIYIDAATDQSKQISAGGMLLIHEKKQVPIHHFLSSKTNNEAEFEIMVFVLLYLLDKQLNHETIFIHSDSKVVVQSIEKEFVRDAVFKPYLKEILRLKSSFNLVFIKLIDEKQNKGADQLAKQALQKLRKDSPDRSSLLQKD